MITATSFFESDRQAWEHFKSLEDLKSWMSTNSRALDTNPARWCAVERSLAIAKKAKAMGIPIIIGAQVGETSILTRASLTLASQYRDILLAQEGAFGTYLLEHDITDTPLMFGAGGTLDPQPISAQPGLGHSGTISISFF
ncbi:MAG: hypothetical protein WD032_04260 [Nitrospirales bacterium]